MSSIGRAYRCVYCDSAAEPKCFLAPEMMFGHRDAFDYFECASCGSLQIRLVPAQLATYYPADYYSLSVHRRSWLVRWVKRLRFRLSWRRAGIATRLLARVAGRERIVDWLAPTGVRFSDPILDVGSGSGVLLSDLRNLGFRDLLGVDPYVQTELSEHGLRVRRCELGEVVGRFALVVFNHSLEHVSDPAHSLRMARKLLLPGGQVLIRIPISQSYAWRTYGTDWVQLDAPRHLSIPSEAGIRCLAERVGFSVSKITYDSTAFQFVGSEKYRAGVPLLSGQGGGWRSRRFSRRSRDLREYERRSVELNDRGDGDQACIVLRTGE